MGAPSTSSGGPSGIIGLALCRFVLISTICCTLVTERVFPQNVSRPDEGPLRFSQLSSEDGLSQQSVFAILQDRHGFMWFGLMGTLNRYDGFRFTAHEHDPNEPNSLSTGIIRALLEDRQGMFWIGYDGGGLSRFDPYHETFTHFRHDPHDPHSLSDDRVRALYEDQSGTLWVGAERGGLNRFDPRTGTFERLVYDPSGPAETSAIWSILEDASGTMWLGVGNGLFRYDRLAGDANKFTRYRLGPEQQTTMGANWVTALHEDRSGTLWVGAWGLHRFDRKSGSF